jgi:glycosyltransferase involved in cell wall biosynthesis
VKILFVADGRSPITISWIGYFVDKGHEVHLVSSYPCEVDLRLSSFAVIPVAFSQAAGERAGKRENDLKKTAGSPLSIQGRTIKRLTTPGIRTSFRHWLGVFTVPQGARLLRDRIRKIRPDMVHALRIPYEGMLAAAANPDPPLFISVWGNDFTLHAPANPFMAYFTRKALNRTIALHTDCQRDLRLAWRWGFPQDRPAVVLPSGGGIKPEVFFADQSRNAWIGPHWMGDCEPTVINPRGFRAYVRNDVFFQAIPRILKSMPETRFVCPAMADERTAQRWAQELGIASAVDLLPAQSSQQMGELFRKSQVAVSLSEHDGTPNSLLEAMACGCFPIAGDIESLREWIDPGVNGLLVNPKDPGQLAEAVIKAFEQPDWVVQAARYNQDLIADRAEYEIVMAKAEAFYRQALV